MPPQTPPLTSRTAVGAPGSGCFLRTLLHISRFEKESQVDVIFFVCCIATAARRLFSFVYFFVLSHKDGGATPVRLRLGETAGTLCRVVMLTFVTSEDFKFGLAVPHPAAPLRSVSYQSIYTFFYVEGLIARRTCCRAQNSNCCIVSAPAKVTLPLIVMETNV